MDFQALNTSLQDKSSDHIVNEMRLYMRNLATRKYGFKRLGNSTSLNISLKVISSAQTPVGVVLLDPSQLASLAATSIIVGFSGALMPGPVFVAVLIESTKRGYTAGPLIVVGHAIVETITVAGLCLGLNLLIGSTTVRILIGILGGSFLLWMGIGLLRSAKIASLAGRTNSSKILRYGPIVAGVLTTITNPTFYIWWATIGNSFLLQGLLVGGFVGVMIFTFSHWFSDLSWYSLVSISVHKGRKAMSDRVYRVLLATCGIFLIALSLTFITDSLKLFL